MLSIGETKVLVERVDMEVRVAPLVFAGYLIPLGINLTTNFLVLVSAVSFFEGGFGIM